MKKLKYLHPFNGKDYPLLISAVAAIVMPLILLALGLDFGNLPVMLVTFALIMSVCLLIERHLSAEERSLIAESQSPLWHPVNETVRQKLTDKYSDTQLSVTTMVIASLAIGAVVFVLGILPGRHSVEFKDPAVILPIAAGAAVIGLIVMLIRKAKGASWLDIDETAMYTVIPVHHCFEVKHHSKRRTWYTNYLVFYQPDGRYVLRIPENTGECGAVMLVKYHGAVTWIPVST